MSHGFPSKERFPEKTYEELKSTRIGPCKMLHKFDENAYEVELPQDLDISTIFNVVDLYPSMAIYKFKYKDPGCYTCMRGED